MGFSRAKPSNSLVQFAAQLFTFYTVKTIIGLLT